MTACGSFDARGLLGGDVRLLVLQGRASMRVAPLAQVLGDEAGVEMGGQRFGQRGLAGAFGAYQCNEFQTRLQARQPITLIGMKPA